jgi:hypothetical protein
MEDLPSFPDKKSAISNLFAQVRLFRPITLSQRTPMQPVYSYSFYGLYTAFFIIFVRILLANSENLTEF